MLAYRQKSLLVLFGMMALMAAYLLWFFILNKGTASVSAEPPFAIKTKGIDEVCRQKTCSFQLPPHAYTFDFKKEGYFDDSRKVEIKRGQTLIISPDFRFIPVLNKHKEWLVPLLPDTFISNIKEISLLNEIRKKSLKSTLANIPPQASRLEFSPNGQYGLVITPKNLYLYNVSAQTYKKVSFNFVKIKNIAWALNGKTAALFGQIKNNEGDELYLFDATSLKIEKISSFPQAINNSVLKISPDSKNLIIFESEQKAFYHLDIINKSKKKIVLEKTCRNFSWSPDNAKILILSSETPELLLYDFFTGILKTTAIKTDLDKVVWQDGQNLIFATTQNFQPAGNQPVEKVPFLKVIETMIFPSEKQPTLFLQYNLLSDIYRYLLPPEKTADFNPDKLEMGKDGNLYFRAGKTIYKIGL